MDIELAPASPASSSSVPSTPGSHRKARRRSSFKPKTPTLRKRNPRWEGQVDLPVFDLIPDELVIRIHTYLDVPTIGLTAQLNTRFNEIAQDVPLWRDLSGRGDWDNKKNPPNNTVTRSFYVRKFISFRREEKLREELALQQKRREKREEDIYRSAVSLLCLLFARPYEWICTIAVILFTIFVILKLDGHTSHWSWAVVFIPLFIICYQMLFAPLVYDILRARFSCDFEEELAPEKFMRPIFFFLFFLMPLQSGRLINRILVFTPIATLLAFFVLLLLNLMHHNIHWWIVILPLLLFALYLTILPLVVHEPIWNDNKWLDHALPCVGGILILLFVLLLALKLEGTSDMSWYSVMAPLFVLKGLFIIVSACLTFFSHFCCSFWLEDRSRWPGDTASYCIVATAVVLIVLGPLLAFEILLAQHLEHPTGDNRKFAIIFVPLLLLEGFGVCGCCALNLVVLFE